MFEDDFEENLINSMYKQMQEELKEEKLCFLKKGELTVKEKTMKFVYSVKGQKPSDGYPLFFGFHGGGGCPAEVNDSQYENHKNLYKKQLPSPCIWFVPRSCQNLPDMWHRYYLENFFVEIIQAFTIIGEVNPNKVYLTGYSAGGDGIYHMAPRMADWICGAAMMAGHPNEVNLLNIRNILFSIQVGGLDHAYQRNEWAEKYILKLNQLQQKYGGYVHWSQVYKDKGHWLNKEDARVFPWFVSHSRNPYPELILFTQHPKRKKQLFYYIRIECTEKKYENEEMAVFKNGNTFEIFSNNLITIMVNRKMINMKQNVKIYHNGIKTVDAKPTTNEEIIKRTLYERKDPNFIFEDEFVSTPVEEGLKAEEVQERKENLIILEKEKWKFHEKEPLNQQKNLRVQN